MGVTPKAHHRHCWLAISSVRDHARRAGYAAKTQGVGWLGVNWQRDRSRASDPYSGIL